MYIFIYTLCTYSEKEEIDSETSLANLNQYNCISIASI